MNQLFQPLPPSFSLKGIASSQQKAPYFSPCAENVGKPSADLELLYHCMTHKLMRELHKAELSCVCNAQHSFVFKCLKESHLPEKKWFVGVAHYSGSCGVVWPVQLDPVPLSSSAAVVAFQNCADPTFLPTMQLHHPVARPVAWESWAGQCVK